MSTPSNLPLRRFVAGNPFFSEVTTENLNQPVDALNELRADLVLNRDASLVGDGVVIGAFIGVITDTGPNDESDDTTAPRYWVIRQRPNDDLEAGELLTLTDENVPGVADTVRATNLSEDSGSHQLATDETVYVTVLVVAHDIYPTIVHYYFQKESSVILSPVALTQTGGTIGTKSTASTWTYTVKTIDSVTTLLTGASPLVAWRKGALPASTFGMGYYPPGGGDFVLAVAFTTSGTGGC